MFSKLNIIEQLKTIQKDIFSGLLDTVMDILELDGVQ
jgi:hypothetical protein